MTENAHIFSAIVTSIFLEAVPFLAIGSLISAFVDVMVPSERLIRYIPKNRLGGIALGIGAGMILPICECGVVVVSIFLTALAVGVIAEALCQCHGAGFFIGSIAGAITGVPIGMLVAYFLSNNAILEEALKEEDLHTDIWFRTDMPIVEIADLLEVSDREADAENRWEWLNGTHEETPVSITRDHTVPPLSVDTRIYSIANVSFPDATIDKIVSRLQLARVEPIHIGRWLYKSGNDWDKLHARTVNLL